jgi:hypothetical protein
MSGLNLLVFRAGRRRVSVQKLKAALTGRLQRLDAERTYEAVLDALLLAGELECGVADVDARAACSCELLNDQIAEILLRVATDTSSSRPNPFFLTLCSTEVENLIDAARVIPTLRQLSISTPEGFAYYALHPLAYADVLCQMPACEHLLVVGIRSIGTTLSAVAAAAARSRGIRAERITVRPQGHPYNRSLEFTGEQLAVVSKAVSCGSSFIVVDEGPGLSGSSFLAVAEALERAGAPTEKIVLVSSHAPNIDALCATDAVRRWQRYTCIAVAAEARRPARAVTFIGGGHWRSHLIGNEGEWPTSWTSLERLKYLSPTDHDARRFFKFAGLGHYGDVVFERERKVAAAGFAPMPVMESDGFVSYPWISARPLSARNLSPEVLVRLAEYCAFRVRTFSVELSDLRLLQEMANHNLDELGLDCTVELRLERPVIADGKMQPHEWLVSTEGKLVKTDSGSHGDDHFFPGPTDIAWDLAGAIVEWQMNDEQIAEFLDTYHRASGDDARARINDFTRAYAVFRSAYCLMAANAMSGSDEQPRLRRAANGYRAVLDKMKARSMVAVYTT